MVSGTGTHQKGKVLLQKTEMTKPPKYAGSSFHI